MTLTETGLALGDGTILARRAAGRGHPDLAVAGAETRILALLSVAYGRAVDPGVLGNIRRAARAWRDGEACLALIHLARTGLPRLSDDGAGYRLFAADRLLACGIDARDLLTACDIDTARLDLVRAGFNPDQPRVPAGAPDGGQWADSETGAGSGSSVPAGAEDAASDGQSGPSESAMQFVGYKRVDGFPTGAVVVIPPDGIPIEAGDPPKPLIAPERADFRDVHAAGERIAAYPLPFQIALIKANLEQGGVYDFQRDPIRQEHYPAYISASNYAVGVYMAGVGFTLVDTITFATSYAFFNSSNYGSLNQRAWIIKGWEDAATGRWR